MRSHHFTVRRLPVDQVPEAYVSWCRGDPDTAIVFVHGFGGDALGTWNDFDVLLSHEPGFERTDVYYYGYDSIHLSATDSASLLVRFLDLVAADGNALFARTKTSSAAGRADFGGYARFVIVCHSLGSVVSRIALLRTRDSGSRLRPWAGADLLFFAPAHCGAKPLELARAAEALPLFSLVSTGIGLWRFPPLAELRPGSRLLETMRSWAERYLGEGRDPVVATPIHAIGDAVVENCDFPGDRAPHPVQGRSHSTLCKPGQGYHDPVNLLRVEMSE